MSAVELIEYALRDAEVPMSDMLARALEQIESDLATAEQDSRQKQARIERMTNRLRLILEEPENTMSNSKAMREMLRQARLALEESK